MQILQKIIICGNISLIIALWTDIFIAYIVLNRISTFLRQFYPGDLANFAGSSIIFSFIAAVIIGLFGKIVAFPWWSLLLLLLWYFFIDDRTWWYLVSSSSPPSFFGPILLLTNLWVSRSLRYLSFLGKLFLGVF